MRLIKLQVGAVILASFAGGVAPVTAQAATSNPTVGNTITVNYESNIKNMLYDINSTVDAINVMVEKGLVTNDILTALSEQLMQLSTVIGVEGASEDVLTTLTNVTNVFKNVVKTEENAKGYNRVETALNIVDTLKNINTPTSTPVQTPTEKTLSETAPIVDAAKATTKKTYATKFTDVTSKTTNYKYIKYLTDAGALGGYKDGKFKPATKMTNGKFISMLVRAINPKSARATKGNDFEVKLMSTAISLGILTKYELSTEEYSKAMTRADMILWTARALDFLGEEDIYLGTNILYLVGDLDKVEALGEKYTEALEQVLEKGILSVDKNKKINPTGTVTRSTSAVIIARVANAKYRVDMQKKADRNELPMQQTVVREARTLKWSDRNRPLPQKGDTFIDKNGKKTVLTSIWVDGKEIIGYGQNIQDLYGNMLYGTRGLKHGDLGGEWHGDSRYLGSPYYIDKATGVGYFQKDWLTIATYESGLVDKVKNPKDGQKVGWARYYADDRVWVFTGPQ